ncbi:MAG: hypothetical protein HYU36_15650 [Planctomycetes bacterium]|nr:hypothetical protein [Planctomycetota bacterium]
MNEVFADLEKLPVRRRRGYLGFVLARVQSAEEFGGAEDPSRVLGFKKGLREGARGPLIKLGTGGLLVATAPVSAPVLFGVSAIEGGALLGAGLTVTGDSNGSFTYTHDYTAVDDEGGVLEERRSGGGEVFTRTTIHDYVGRVTEESWDDTLIVRRQFDEAGRAFWEVGGWWKRGRGRG